MATDLMEQVAFVGNLHKAMKAVQRNEGCAGIDKMSVEELEPWMEKNWKTLVDQLLSGEYRPSPVLGVEIPKPGGGVRQLGIPTVIDHLVQQEEKPPDATSHVRWCEREDGATRPPYSIIGFSLRWILCLPVTEQSSKLLL